MKKAIALLTFCLLLGLNAFARNPERVDNSEAAGRSGDGFDDRIEMGASDAGNPGPKANIPAAVIQTGKPMGWYYSSYNVVCSFVEPVASVEVIFTPLMGSSSYRRMFVSENSMHSMLDVTFLKKGSYTASFMVKWASTGATTTYKGKFSR